MQFTLQPVYNSSQTVTAANARIRFQSRIINNGDSTDIKYTDTQIMDFDMLGSKAASIVNVAGLGNITVQQTAAAIRKIADALRAGTL